MATPTNTIILAREALLPALALVIKAVERRSTIPVLQNILMAVDASAGTLTLTGTDLDCELRTSLPCQAGRDDSFTLPATLLHDAVRKMADGAEIAIAAEKDFATVSAGRARFKIQVLPAADFPAMSEAGYANTFELDAGALRAMLATVSFAISSEETRYYLNGIHWHVDEHLHAVATDGHRLAKFTAQAPEGAAGMPDIIIPRHTVDLIGKILEDKRPVKVEVSDTRIRLTSGSVSLVSKLIDGTFPDYRRVIPAGNANHFTVAKDALVHAVDRVMTVASGKGSAVKFTFAGETLTLTTNNPEAGSADDEIAIDVAEGEAVEIGFNGRYCLDLFGATEGKRLTFSLDTAGSPTLIRPEDGDPSSKPLFVLMPMRVT